MNIFSSIELLKLNGFEGFLEISYLNQNIDSIPREKGVYFVICAGKDQDFLPCGTGGHFKGRNPNVQVDMLRNKWIDESMVLYIGKAGGSGSNATLRSRLRQYLLFGQGRNIGHWGGRYIWQLKNAENLLICWKTLPSDDPREIEIQLLNQFLNLYSKLPFANLI